MTDSDKSFVYEDFLSSDEQTQVKTIDVSQNAHNSPDSNPTLLSSPHSDGGELPLLSSYLSDKINCFNE